MTAPVLSQLVRSTVARIRVRGIPSLLAGTARFVLGDKPRLLPVADGYYVHIDPRDSDQCMMYYGYYGRGILHFARDILRPGDTALDIGGQLGYLAAAFGTLVGSTGQVVTFEPDPQVWPRLLKAVHRNDHLPVTARNIAIADRAGESVLHVSATAGWSTLLDSEFPQIGETRVETHALDDLLPDDDIAWHRLRLVKIDVEGAELAVLDGMRQVIDRHHPHLICEMNEPCLRAGHRTPDELLQRLVALGYRVQAITEPRGLLRTAAPALLDIASARDLPWRVGDLLCTPEAAR